VISSELASIFIDRIAAVVKSANTPLDDRGCSVWETRTTYLTCGAFTENMRAAFTTAMEIFDFTLGLVSPVMLGLDCQVFEAEVQRMRPPTVSNETAAAHIRGAKTEIMRIVGKFAEMDEKRERIIRGECKHSPTLTP